jgi:hypothetical protein
LNEAKQIAAGHVFHDEVVIQIIFEHLKKRGNKRGRPPSRERRNFQLPGAVEGASRRAMSKESGRYITYAVSYCCRTTAGRRILMRSGEAPRRSRADQLSAISSVVFCLQFHHTPAPQHAVISEIIRHFLHVIGFAEFSAGALRSRSAWPRFFPHPLARALAQSLALRWRAAADHWLISAHLSPFFVPARVRLAN